MSTNPLIHFFQAFHYEYVGQFLFATDVLQGIILTLVFSVLAQLFGSLIGLLLYFMRRSRVFGLRPLAEGYVWLFRGTPLLVQILFIYYLLPALSLARPLINLHIFRHLGFLLETPFDAFISGLLALALNEGAYMAEIVRAGIDSIDVGQLEAARSLGMTYGQAMRRIVLPQALRVIIPPLGNEFNSMLKSSSLVYAIGAYELLSSAYAHGFSLGSPLELLVVATIWYLVLTTIWGFIQAWIERRLNASNIDPGQLAKGNWWNRIIGFGRTTPGAEVPAPAGIDHR
ncbi:MAG TPA: amino acid ABC transporter permease [Ktedonobacterales bacterium]|nr:amino acid ABC transporter permease [Ktedonobacterales bacterium]